MKLIQRETESWSTLTGASRITWRFTVDDGELEHTVDLVYWIASRSFSLSSYSAAAPRYLTPQDLADNLPDSERAYALAISISGECPDDTVKYFNQGDQP